MLSFECGDTSKNISLPRKIIFAANFFNTVGIEIIILCKSKFYVPMCLTKKSFRTNYRTYKLLK